MNSIRPLFLILIVLLSVFPDAYGQNNQENSYFEGYVLPRTVFNVTITQQKETVKSGPYARFAQKYLGVAAPLSNREIYSIKEAYISSYEEPDFSVLYSGDAGNKISLPTAGTDITKNTENTPYVKSHTYDAYGFLDIGPDKYSTVDYSLEDMASMAADRIFTIRKRRFDLVTGEAGENVFGAGIKDALDEMQRMEEEYLALFLGKTITEEITKTYTVAPEKGHPATILCRFTEAKGLVPDTDLSGRPVTLEITVKGEGVIKTGRDSKDNKIFRIPEYAQCTVKEGNNLYANEILPVYQFGKDIELPASTKK